MYRIAVATLLSTLTSSAASSACQARIQPAPSVVQVDRSGQSVRGDWLDKLQSEADLKADVAAGAAYYAGFHPSAADHFGGLPGSGAKPGLTKSGFFRVQKIGNATEQ